MRSWVLALLVAGTVLVGGSAFAQSSDSTAPANNGGLTVCCGGTFGYAGGSGGVSGRVVGPGGGGTAVQPAPAPAKPSAVNSGVVAPAKVPVVHIPAQEASSSGHPDVLTWVMVALMAFGALFLYRRLPRTA